MDTLPNGTHMYTISGVFYRNKVDHVCNYTEINIYIQSNEIHNVVALIKCLLVLRCQLYMFRTITVHPQELLCRYCTCRLWYVVRNALHDMSSWYNILPQTLYQLDISGSASLTTYHSLHIQYLQRSS